MNPIQHGGLKQVHSTKTGFTPVYDMINSPSAKLSLLTANSLKRFIISLSVDSEDAEYKDAEYKSKFTAPKKKIVTEYIIKFAVITPSEENLPPYNNIHKASETRDSYVNEAKMQQRIWSDSIKEGLEEICPPIANFSVLDNDNSKKLMTSIINNPNPSLLINPNSRENARDVLNYLLDTVTNNRTYELGIIVMPKVNNSITLSDFLDLEGGYVFNGVTVIEDQRQHAIMSVLTKKLRLFLNIGVIHFDLHANNALIYVKNGILNSLIIDFGQESNKDHLNNHYFQTTKDALDKLSVQIRYSANSNPKFTKGIVIDFQKIITNIPDVPCDPATDSCKVSGGKRYTTKMSTWRKTMKSIKARK